MKTRERVVIYSLLAVLLAVNVLIVLGTTGRAAFADPFEPGGELGPGQTLTLLNDAGDAIVLRNGDGRIAWSDKASHRAYSFAFVHIGAVLNQLMNNDAYVEERESLVAELNEEESEFRSQIDAIIKELQGLSPDSTEAVDLRARGDEVWEQYMQWQEDAINRRGKLDAEHLERAYRELIDAVEVVADQKQIDIVYRFIPTSDDFESDNPEEAMLAIRLRTALRYPEALDITDDVLEEMDLAIE